MPSFDVVSEVDQQEARNAVDQANRELRTRFDFKKVDAGFLLESDSVVRVWAEEEFQLNQLKDILYEKMSNRKIDVKALIAKEIEASGRQKRQNFELRNGIDQDTSRLIVKIVKDTKKKVQAQIQGEKLRVTGKKRDDLQAVIAEIRNAGLSIPIEFNNFRD